MAATMTSSTTTILAAKGILQILHFSIEFFDKRFRKKVLRANVDFDPK